jgi:phosphatidylinositol alpha-1,6-mannosyltransferase
MPCRTRRWGLEVEAWGIVFLEAQACGLPVVVGDSGGAPETLAGPSRGEVWRRGEDSLAQALVRQMRRGRLTGVPSPGEGLWTWRQAAGRLAELWDQQVAPAAGIDSHER